jgi:hypothetical protein
MANTNASETVIVRQFQLAVCSKEGNKCPYWDSGCTIDKKACKKLANYRANFRKKEKAIEDELKAAMAMRKKSEPTILISQVEEKLENIKIVIDLARKNIIDISSKSTVSRAITLTILAAETEMKELEQLIRENKTNF